ncbi:coiled-coil domain-containing protein 180 isoform X2 [Betta splendens]|uniref:Coiled-coil domain-containing protein 180 isoform X2 n=1 Tax=Betta splendens TaxID=158456 RepID=A0A6P7NGG1_BETSP|nr:coiled-coil domain-containing protein 180 isoform X2 [Betta splendens]
MCESRAVPSGKVYRQVFDAQLQLSRSLLAGRKATRMILSAEDSRMSSSREQPVDSGEDEREVSRLPDAAVVDRPSSDFIKQLTEKRNKKHKETVKQLNEELTQLTQVCERQVRTVGLELLSSLQDVDLRLDKLKHRMEQLENQDQLCGWFGLWQQVEQEMTLKKIRVMELSHKLIESEHQRADKIRSVLRKHRHLLEKISFLLSQDVQRLIHTEAMMLNQSLLVNRRSTARLLLHLQEENLQQESLLHLHWDECLNRWRRSRVAEVIDSFRCLLSSGEDQRLVLVLQSVSEPCQVLAEQRQNLISSICSLVPPTCSTNLVSDWFTQLTGINQQIYRFQANLLLQLRCGFEQKWQKRLAQVELCKEQLLALQLPMEEVNSVISSQLLTLTGQHQHQDEEELAALDVSCDSVASHALALSRSVFVMMRGAALLWEMHSHRLQRREEELHQHLGELHQAQQQGLQRKKVHLEKLLVGLRQESSEEALKASLEKTSLYMQDVQHSCRQCVSDQCEVLDHLPDAFEEELRSYSRSLSRFYHLDHAYLLDDELLRSSVQHPQAVCAEPTQPAWDWLTEAESSLTHLSDLSMCVTFQSSRGVTYTGPAFHCPASLGQHGRNLSMFPVELLTHTLNRTRTLFLDHLEQHFHDILSSAVATVNERKEALSSQQELYLQQLDPQHIQTHIYEPRLAELQLHRQWVDIHCKEQLDLLTSCRMELQELQTSISRRNQEFTVTLSHIENDIKMATSTQCLDTAISTLQDCLDQHIKHTQCCQTTFRRTLQSRLGHIRNGTAQLLSSFRLFSEGGDFASQEVKLCQRTLQDITNEISVAEESIYSKLEAFESEILQQVKEASDRLEEKLSFIQSEVKFTWTVQKIMSNIQVNIKTEAASCTQQQLLIRSHLDELMKMLAKPQACQDEVLCCLLSLCDGLRLLCGHLGLMPDVHGGFALTAPLLQPRTRAADLSEDPVVCIIQSLNKVCAVQPSPAAAAEPEAGPVQHFHHKPTDAVSALRASCRSIRTDRRFHIFGPTVEQDTHSYRSAVNSALWKANDVLLKVAEEFYCSERLNRFQLVPDTLDQWTTDSMQQRLLAYQGQALGFLSRSRYEMVAQLSALDELLHSLPSVLISNLEQQQKLVLTEEVAASRWILEEMLGASEQEKLSVSQEATVRQLRASLPEDELQALNRREELRQQQLHSAICRSHLEIQERVRVRGEEFVLSLASLTEKLLYHLDNPIRPAGDGQQSEDTVVSIETTTEPGQKQCKVNRTRSGITLLLPPTISTTDPSPSVTTLSTAANITARCTMGHPAVTEQRDAAVKRLEQLIGSVVSRSEDDKRRRLSELQSWKTHWRRQMETAASCWPDETGV